MIRLLLSFLFISLFSVGSLAQSLPQTNNVNEAPKNKPVKGEITGQVISEDGQTFPTFPISLFNLNTRTNVSTTCDENGNFKFSDLPAGLYQASAYSPGYVSAYSQSRDFRIGENITITMIKGGVITGKIFDAGGRPIVGAFVTARRVRDNDLDSLIEGRFGNKTMSDDRGVYRIFGMQGGSYVVSTSLTNSFNTEKIPETRTYFPSSTRDTAQEIVVKVGTETTGIDVVHRSEPGHAISGTLAGTEGIKLDIGTNIQLTSPSSGGTISSTFIRANSSPSFAFYGIPDGEYEVTASQYLNTIFIGATGGIEGLSIPLKVVVRGSDVSGLILRFNKPGEINGRVTLSKMIAPNPVCKISSIGYLEETTILAMKEEQGSLTNVNRAAPLNNGDFSLTNVPSGIFRFNTKFQNDFWYLKSVIHSAKTSKIDVAKQGVFVKPGEKISGLSLLLAEGAASIQGKIIAEQNQKLPSKLRVHLIPAEPQEAENLTRYFEVITRTGEFTFSNLAPGKYWLYAGEFSESESPEIQRKPLAWDAKSRAQLRREAEAAGNLLELNSCQRVNDYSLKFSQTKK